MTNDEKLYCVYKHTSPNGKVYIGMTDKHPPEKRWYSNGSGYKRQLLFWRAICKYGWDNFEHEILFDNLSLEDAANKEKELIAMYDSTNPEKGYNCSTGGEYTLAGVQWTDERRKQRSESMKGENNHFFGRKHSQSSKEKMSKSQQGHPAPNKGKIPSKETLNLWSKQRKGKKYNKNKNMSYSEKENSSKAHNFQKKSIIQLDKDGNVISEYESITAASKATNTNIGNISKCCRKGGTANGYVWKYKNDKDNNKYKTSATKSVVQLEQDGTVVAEYSSITEASNITGVSNSGIGACCNNKRLSAGGFIWRFKQDE